MLNQKYKDLKRRSFYKNNEIKSYITSGIAFLKDKKFEYCKQNLKRVQTQNRCVITYRNRSVLRTFKITRGVLRKLLSNSEIIGYNKSSW